MSENADRRLTEWARETRVWNDYPPSLLRCYADWLRTVSPSDWHRAAKAWNWDYGIAPMYWIACQSACDLATAVLIYYLAGPSYYRHWRSENMPERAREGFQLITKIRDRVAAGDYKSAIALDPRHELATEMRLAPISEDPGFPAVLLGALVARLVDWDDGFPHKVWSAARHTG